MKRTFKHSIIPKTNEVHFWAFPRWHFGWIFANFLNMAFSPIFSYSYMYNFVKLREVPDNYRSSVKFKFLQIPGKRTILQNLLENNWGIASRDLGSRSVSCTWAGLLACSSRRSSAATAARTSTTEALRFSWLESKFVQTFLRTIANSLRTPSCFFSRTFSELLRPLLQNSSRTLGNSVSGNLWKNQILK